MLNRNPFDSRIPRGLKQSQVKALKVFLDHDGPDGITGDNFERLGGGDRRRIYELLDMDLIIWVQDTQGTTGPSPAFRATTFIPERHRPGLRRNESHEATRYRLRGAELTIDELRNQINALWAYIDGGCKGRRPRKGMVYRDETPDS